MQLPWIWLPMHVLVIDLLGSCDDVDDAPEVVATYKVAMVVKGKGGTDGCVETEIEVNPAAVELAVVEDDCDCEFNEQVPSRLM